MQAQLPSRPSLDAFRIFHFINSPIDRLIANRKQKREQQQHKSETGREREREGERVSEFGNSFCMLRPERCNKNQARDEFAQSAGNYLHVYTEIETQQTQRTHAGTHTTHSTHTDTHCCPYVTLANSIKGVNLHRKHRETHINCAINEAKSAKRIREQFRRGEHMRAFTAGTVQPAHEPGVGWEQLALAGGNTISTINECENSLSGKACLL